MKSSGVPSSLFPQFEKERWGWRGNKSDDGNENNVRKIRDFLELYDRVFYGIFGVTEKIIVHWHKINCEQSVNLRHNVHW